MRQRIRLSQLSIFPLKSGSQSTFFPGRGKGLEYLNAWEGEMYEVPTLPTKD